MSLHEPSSGVRKGLLDSVFTTFGEHALDDGLFYQNAPALRFELSGGGTRIAMFTRAYERARMISALAFDRTDILTVVLTAFVSSEDEVLKTRRTLTRSLYGLGLVVKIEETRLMPGDEDAERLLLSFELPSAQLDELLWGVLAQELGVRPRLWPCRVHIADVTTGVLVHPYDDRGMDVIGPNEVMLRRLFNELSPWLLAFDLKRMQGFFVSA